MDKGVRLSVAITIAVITLVAGALSGYFAAYYTLPRETLTRVHTEVLTVVRTTTALKETTVTATTTVTITPPISVIDALGRIVEFRETPKRVVSTMPSITEILFALGLGDRVVGVTTYCNYPPEVPELVKEGKLKTVGGPWTLDIEAIASLNPDLVLLSMSPHIRLKDKFDELKVKYVFLRSYKDAYDIATDIMLVAKIFGVEDRAVRIVSAIFSNVTFIVNRLTEANATKPKVLLLIGPPSWGLYSAGGDTFIGWLIETVGGKNIARMYSGWPQLSSEFILAQNPDIIIVTVHDIDPKSLYSELASAPYITETNAWKNKRVYLLTGEANDVVSRPGPRITVALNVLARVIHPEIFGEVSRGDVVNIAMVGATSTPILQVIRY